MRFRILIILLSFYCSLSYGQVEIDYFDQTPPVLTPDLFAKGIISSDHQEHSSLCISPDGTEMWWSLWELPYGQGQVQKIFFSKFDGKKWSKPKLANFSGTYKDGGPCMSFDGKKIFFYSKRPLPPDTIGNNHNIWFVERTPNGWSDPKNVGNIINTDFVEACPVLVSNNNLYFTSNRDNQFPDIYLSQFINGQYTSPVMLNQNINTSDAREMFFTVSPDETFIIFSRDDRQFSETGELISGERNLMISFKDKNNEWGKSINMGEVFNEKKARFPSLSPDGKYLFFTRYTDYYDEDFYWISTKIIKELKNNQ